MKRTFIIVLLVLFSTIGQAQEEVFIYNGNEKEYFEVNSFVKYVKCYGKQNCNINNLFEIFPTTEQVMPDVFKVTLNSYNQSLFDIIISEIDSVFAADELIYKKDGTRQCCFNHIMLQTKGSADLSELLEIFSVPYISFEKFGMCENEYLLKLSVSEALHYANILFESGYFVYAQPSFYRFGGFHTNESISISPNPNNGSFHVSLSINEDEITRIRVFDTMGKIIYLNSCFNGGEVVLPDVKHGVYYVVVTLKDKTITEKIIIQ